MEARVAIVRKEGNGKGLYGRGKEGERDAEAERLGKGQGLMGRKRL